MMMMMMNQLSLMIAPLYSIWAGLFTWALESEPAGDIVMNPAICAQGQGQGQRSRDTGTFVLDLKSLFLAGK